MSGRRGHHEGSVFRRKSDGKWVAALDLGYQGGRRRRRTFYGETQQQALKKLGAAKRELDDGLSLGGRDQSLERYIANWLAQRDPRTRSAAVRKLRWTTWEGYENRMRVHVLPVLGSMPLGKIEPDHVRGMLSKVAGKSLSDTTVAMVRDTLGTILQRAVKDRILPYNPVRSVDAVARSKPRTYVMTADQARALLGAAAGDRFEAVVVLALHAGLRSSELFGLRWEDVDLDTATLTVKRALHQVTGQGLRTSDPKTASSAASIPLTSVAVAALRAHRKRQIEQRLRAGEAWNDTGYVFTTEVGTPVSALNFLRRNFYPIAKRAGLPTGKQKDGSWGVRLHDLRHACGSLLISVGAKPKLVQRILRHSRLQVTMDLYVHAFDDDVRDAVDMLGRAIG